MAKQTNVTWSLTFDPADKTPVINNRIFGTLAEAQAYIDNPDSSAIPGITLSVINDSDKNGLYRVASIVSGDVAGVLEKLASSAESEGNTEAIPPTTIDDEISKLGGIVE